MSSEKNAKCLMLHNKDRSNENLNRNCDIYCNCKLIVPMRKFVEENIQKMRRKNIIETTFYFPVDLQKIIMLPRLEMFKQVLFCPKIVAYNGSFEPLKSLNKKIVGFAVR
jgi:hypothetical protein